MDGISGCETKIRRFFAFETVDDFVAAGAHEFNRVQQISTTRHQQVPQQSLGNNKILQVSITTEIWFGTRGSEVQILSPRPIVSNHLQQTARARKPTHRVLQQVLSRAAPHKYWNFCSAKSAARPQNRLQQCDGQTRCPASRKLLNYKESGGAAVAPAASARINSPLLLLLLAISVAISRQARCWEERPTNLVGPEMRTSLNGSATRRVTAPYAQPLSESQMPYLPWLPAIPWNVGLEMTVEQKRSSYPWPYPGQRNAQAAEPVPWRSTAHNRRRQTVPAKCQEPTRSAKNTCFFSYIPPINTF